jgi:hypothetical protein
MIERGVAYFGVRRVEHVKRDMQNIVEHGATYVIHMLSENDWRYYAKTMQDIIKVSEEVGLSTWIDPVSLGQVFGGEEFGSDFVALHPESALIDQFGQQQPTACINQPIFRKFVKDWIKAAVETGAEAILWDEPHMFIGEWFGRPGRWGCTCPVCQDLYKSKYGESMPKVEEDPGVLKFKSDSILSLLEDSLIYTKSLNTKNHVVLIPEEFTGINRLRWEEVAKLPYISSLGTDPYPFPSFSNQKSWANCWVQYVGNYAERLVNICREHNLNNHLWIQGFSIPEEDNGYVAGVFDLALSKGINNLAVWGFDGHRDMSIFSCAQPDKVWNTIGQGFNRIARIK